MNRLSNNPSLASSTVSRTASCSAGPTSTRMSGEPITLNSTWRWSCCTASSSSSKPASTAKPGRRVRHDALLDAAALADREQLRVADVVAAQRAAVSCATTSVVAAPRARPSTVLFASSTASRIAGRSCGSSRGTDSRTRDERLHGRVRRLAPGRRAADAVGDREHERVRRRPESRQRRPRSAFALSGERTLRTQTSPCGSEDRPCSRSCSPRKSSTCSPARAHRGELARARSRLERLRAPRAEVPKVRVDAPTAMRAARRAAR